ncbi:MAG: hypothetical protein J6Y53_05225 [Alphaproteobacteria bacterium]|nr:hypothetical protein [Alphaproteobacteria bacterium]
MTDFEAHLDNEEFENFLINNFENIKKQGAAFIDILEKLAQMLDDDKVSEIIEKLKNS